MTATEKRHRRWVLTGTFLVCLGVSSAICGVYRSAHADPVPVVVLPSARPAMPTIVPVRVLSIPASAPGVDTRLVVQAPELLPLPLPIPEKAPRPRAAEVPDVTPIENPVPVTPPPVVALPRPAPSGLPLVPPLAPSVQPKKSAPPAQSPPVVPPDFRLQPAEPRHNVTSADPSISKESSPLPVSVPPALQPPLTTPGDPPMPMSFRRTALSALVGTALVTGTMYADADPPKGEPAVTKKDLDHTNQLLADLKKELSDLKTKDLDGLKQQLTALKAKDLADFQKDVAALRTKDLADVKKDLESLKDFKKRTLEALEGTADRGAGGDGLVKKITALDDKLTALNKQLEGLDKKLDSTRTALASPVTKEAEKEKPKLGSVKLVNMYAADVDIVVNGKGYRVAPNETKTLALAVGSFTYQLLTGGGEEKTRTLKDGEEVTLMVNN